MQYRLRLVGLLGLITLAVVTVLVPQAAGALAPPKTGVIEVTGYQHVGIYGGYGSVVVVAQGAKAAAIRTALAGLPAPSSAPWCMESGLAFKVAFLPRIGAPPVYVATEEDCPTPGRVLVAVAGGSTQQLSEDCSLRAAVIAALPRGKAEGTRRDKSLCSVSR